MDRAPSAPLRAETLLEMYESARAYDATWQSAKAQYDANLYRAEQARAGILPAAGLGASVARSQFDSIQPALGERYFTAQSATISASQPLYRPANFATYQQGKRQIELAEAQLTAWQSWVTTNKKTWMDAGREFRKRMAAAGYEASLGDMWALNEVPSTVRQNAGQSRRNLLDFLKGLYEGDGSAPATQGLVFVVGLGQRTQNLSVYLANMQGWLSDSAFWTEADAYVRFWAQETYGDIRAWGVASAPAMTRARHLIDYVTHPLALARAGGERSAAAEAFLRRTYLALGNAAWRWQSGFGFTDVDDTLMRHFLSEQVFAIRHDAGTHPAEGPEGRLGFAWAPDNDLAPAQPDFPAKTAGLQERLASALANAYAQGGSSQQGACGPPGDRVWCEGAFDGSAFNDGWSVFSNPWT